MNAKICTIVTGNTIDKFLINLKRIQAQACFVELRVDFINNLKLEHIKIIQEKTHKKSILTCRSRLEGGNFQRSEKDRISIIQEALRLKFDYIDIELSAINKINLKNKNKQLKIICSYHDFKKTPSYEKLEEIASKMKKDKKCDIIKVVTMVKKEEDNQKLFQLLLNKDKKQKMIVLGMGEFGKITRILSPLLGGYLTFASLNEIESAPGQINIAELTKIYNKILKTI